MQGRSIENIRGVNLGGWLVLEKWLTPDLFAGTNAIDEYTLMQTPDCHKKLENHRRSYITEGDFRWLSQQGINLVRIPVGYWLFEPIDGFIPAAKYLDRAMKWAAKHSIKILIDLHAARGSQNGFDHSGRSGEREWLKNKEYQAQTLAVLERIAKTYGNMSAFWGIELLNEPVPGWRYVSLRRFYRKAYDKLRLILPAHSVIVIYDFLPWRSRKRISPQIMLDVHWYAYPLPTKSFQTYLRQSAWLRRSLIAIFQLWQPVIVGEWSSVLPPRFLGHLSEKQKDEYLRQNIAMQQKAYKNAKGWFYWNYRANGSGMWNFRSLVETGALTVDSPQGKRVGQRQKQ